VIGDVIPPDWLSRLRADLPADAVWVCSGASGTPGITPISTKARGEALIRELRGAHAGHDILLIDVGIHWPDQAWARLDWARRQVPPGTTVSPLSVFCPALSPLPAGARFDGTLDSLDGHVALRQPREWVAVDTIHPNCSLWTVGPDIARVALTGLVIDRPETRLTGAPLPSDLRDAPPDAALATVRSRWPAADALLPLPTARPGFDGVPVTLHILHGWGGGAAAFVRDYASARSGEWHLLLQSHGSSPRRSFGEFLSLSLVTDQATTEIARWPIDPAIPDTVGSHPGYRSRLRTLIRDYAVDRVLVSSLIGHTLDVFDTGVPTVSVCHDYYPVWPVLHERFDDIGIDDRESSLRRSLAEQSHPFAPKSAADWMALRTTYVDTLTRHGIPVAAPSVSVDHNLHRMAPSFPVIKHVEHGFRPFGPSAPITPNGGPSLRLLVLGRINGGKGEHLIAECLERLTRTHSIWLVGCGKAGERFFGRRNVHVLLDYDRADLPTLLVAVKPDVALMPVTVAETFSFTLSELWALGIVPIASRLGSLAERIEHGTTGWLVDPTAEAFETAIDTLHRDPNALARMRRAIAGKAPRSLAAMRDDYDELFGAWRTRAVEAAVSGEPAPVDERQALASRALRAEWQLRRANERLRDQALELSRRAAWGFDLDREVRQARPRLDRITAERNHAQHELAMLVDTHRQFVVAANEENDRLAGLLQQEQADHLRDNAGWQLEVARLRGEESRLNEQLAATHASTSWRITKPLRFAARRTRDVGTRLTYLWRRLVGNVNRLLGYWRRHGAGAALERARQELGQSESRPTPILDADPVSVELASLVFRTPEGTPRASIIIPVYNKFAYTAACLASLVREGARSSFEVIVVDDGSTDETETSLRGVVGLRYHRNAQNLGFIGACNAGAAIATGEYLVFLNNDTVVRPDWLDALIDTFPQHERVGLVGAKLVYPDGRLQEAGGIIFSDGSGWNYGRFGDPANPAFNYVREVDYCSGAAIAIRRDLFDSFGGFDSRYAPAYYEDTDLAFRVRDHGLRVLYQPASVVVHFEGITSGTDVTTGTKRYQVVNQAKFLERWADALASQPKPGGDIDIAREHRRRDRVLVIDATTPEPDKDSGSVRLVNILKSLVALGHKPVFFAENRQFLVGYSDALQQLGVEVLWGPWLDPIAHLKQHGHRYQAVFVSRHYVLTPLMSVLREYAPRARVLFDTVDLHYLREQRAAALEGKPELLKQAARTQLAELRLTRAADVTLVVSPVEKELLAREVPNAWVEILSNVHEVAGPGPSFADRRDLYFVGGFQHTPNVDAVLWFVKDVWPTVAAALPGVNFHIIGSRMPDTIAALADERIIVHGHVPSMDPFLDGCRLSVAPLRYGAGVKGKVNQSMAHGQPVVATTVAAEGMNLRHEEDVLIADDPLVFAGEVIRLYGDEVLWTRLANAGLANIERHFSIATAQAKIEQLLRG